MEKCVSCKTGIVSVKKRGMCLRCYNKVRYREKYKDEAIQYDAEIGFIKNFFTHNNWIYQPANFHLDGCGYRPDFYDGERNIFIEVSGTRQAFQANFDKYKLFIKTYPKIKFEIRDIYGNLKPLTKKTYTKKQDSAKNKP